MKIQGWGRIAPVTVRPWLLVAVPFIILALVVWPYDAYLSFRESWKGARKGFRFSFLSLCIVGVVQVVCLLVVLSLPNLRSWYSVLLVLVAYGLGCVAYAKELKRFKPDAQPLEEP